MCCRSDISIAAINQFCYTSQLIFGEENRGNVYSYLKQIVSGKFLIVGKGENKKPMAYVKNNTVYFAIFKRKHKDYQIFSFADKPVKSTKELISYIEDALDISIHRFLFPIGGVFWLIIASWMKKFFVTPKFDVSKADSAFFDFTLLIRWMDWPELNIGI